MIVLVAFGATDLQNIVLARLSEVTHPAFEEFTRSTPLFADSPLEDPNPTAEEPSPSLDVPVLIAPAEPPLPATPRSRSPTRHLVYSINSTYVSIYIYIYTHTLSSRTTIFTVAEVIPTCQLRVQSCVHSTKSNNSNLARTQ